MKRIRILLIEENRILREGITATINSESDIKVVAAPANAENVLMHARRLKPNVILLDLGLRSQHGPRLVELLTKELPNIKVIGMGLIPSRADIIEFIKAGASGFLLKDATMAGVLSTIRSVAHGAKILPPLLTGSLFSHVIEQAVQRGRGSLARAVRMTSREREVIALITEGMSNKDIALRLDIAIYTVKSHVHNIMEKLAIHSRLQVALYTHHEKAF